MNNNSQVLGILYVCKDLNCVMHTKNSCILPLASQDVLACLLFSLVLGWPHGLKRDRFSFILRRWGCQQCSTEQLTLLLCLIS